MASKQALERTISSTEDMSSIVRTMKSLAAVNVRVFEEARASLENQVEIIERGFQVALTDSEVRRSSFATTPGNRVAEGEALAIVFGSVQGMCGQFNDHLADHLHNVVQQGHSEPRILATGERIVGALGSRELPPQSTLEGARSFEAVTDQVYEIIEHVERFRADGGVRVSIFYNAVSTQTSYTPTDRQLLPLDEVWLSILSERSWPGSTIPLSLTAPPLLMRELVSRFLFTSVYLAALESLTSENGARLSSMQAAEKNIDERLDELHQEHNRRRQSEITEELLDIVGGYTALGD